MILCPNPRMFKYFLHGWLREPQPPFKVIKLIVIG